MTISERLAATAVQLKILSNETLNARLREALAKHSATIRCVVAEMAANKGKTNGTA